MRFFGPQGDQGPSCRLLGFIVITGPACTRGCWLNLAAGCRDAEHVPDLYAQWTALESCLLRRVYCRCHWRCFDIITVAECRDAQSHRHAQSKANCPVRTAAVLGCRYSVTPEVLALHQASMCKRYGNGHVVADAMAGCGGNVIQMAMVSTHAAGQRS